MTRVGWVFLGLVALVVAAFLATTSFGVRTGDAVSQPPPGPFAAASPDGALVVPVAGVARGALRSSWGDERGGGTRRHHGIDIPAAAGTPVLAAAPGRIEKLFESRLGGTTLYLRSHDGRWIYYYAHLAGYAPGTAEGQRVRAGQPLGRVGDTGDAGPGNYHLHFGMQRMRSGERWWQGEDVDPFPLLAGNTPPR